MHTAPSTSYSFEAYIRARIEFAVCTEQLNAVDWEQEPMPSLLTLERADLAVLQVCVLLIKFKCFHRSIATTQLSNLGAFVYEAPSQDESRGPLDQPRSGPCILKDGLDDPIPSIESSGHLAQDMDEEDDSCGYSDEEFADMVSHTTLSRQGSVAVGAVCCVCTRGLPAPQTNH